MANEELKVYLLEDNPQVYEKMINIFKKYNIKFELFHSGISYLKNYNSMHTGCLLINVDLKDINSFELSDTLNKRGNFMPIIFMGDPGEIATMIRLRQPPVFNCVTVPFEEEEVLLSEIRKSMILSENKQKTQSTEQDDRLPINHCGNNSY